MLEREIIQLRGFRNLKQDGEIIGFQFRIRLNYYRGVWLSMLRPGIVTVDGETIDPKDITWEIGGKSLTIEEVKTCSDVQWANSEAATIKVRRRGGLSQGYHDVNAMYRYIMSYVPPFIDTADVSPFGLDNPNTRRMLIV